jgi:riboflavin biosynthesis pyrimidine reductase
LHSDWRERFESFCARKTSLATAATLQPFVTEIDEPDEGMLPIGNDWSMQFFGGSFYVSDAPNSRRPACSLVFVQSADRNTGASDPATLGGGDTDKHLIYEGLSRVAGDAVLAGAETVRGGDLVFSVWHPELVSLRHSLGLPRHPEQAVATLRGLNLDEHLLFNVPELSAIVITVPAGADVMRKGLAQRPWVHCVVIDRPADLQAAFQELHSRGLRRVSCVGGRHLATQLLDAKLVDDLYLTTSPRSGGEPNTPIYPQPLTGRIVVRKRGSGAESGVLFEHQAYVSIGGQTQIKFRSP